MGLCPAQPRFAVQQWRALIDGITQGQRVTCKSASSLFFAGSCRAWNHKRNCSKPTVLHVAIPVHAHLTYIHSSFLSTNWSNRLSNLRAGLGLTDWLSTLFPSSILFTSQLLTILFIKHYFTNLWFLTSCSFQIQDLVCITLVLIITYTTWLPLSDLLLLYPFIFLLYTSRSIHSLKRQRYGSALWEGVLWRNTSGENVWRRTKKRCGVKEQCRDRRQKVQEWLNKGALKFNQFVLWFGRKSRQISAVCVRVELLWDSECNAESNLNT